VLHENSNTLPTSVTIFIAFEFILGAVSAVLLWPLCARAFKGPFESPGYLVLWPCAIVVSLSPIFIYISAFKLFSRKRSAIFFLFLALTILLVPSALASLLLLFSDGIPAQAPVRVIVHLVTASIVIVAVFSGVFFRRRHVRAVFDGTSEAGRRRSFGRSSWMCFVVFAMTMAMAEGAETNTVAVGKVIRDTASGNCRLVATFSTAPVEFEVYELWRYDSLSTTWLQQKFEPMSKVVQSGTVGILTNEPGLYWVKWKENGDPYQSLVISGRILCNDVHLAPTSEPNVIATCIPFEDSARADYVPDPKIHCQQGQTHK
jgi:hypothetical protein